MRVQATHLPTVLTVRDAFRFPVGTPDARKDLLIGGCLLLTLMVGWVFNLGNRLNVVARLAAGETPYFRGFKPWGHTFRRGCLSLLAIASYLCPAAIFGALAFWFRQQGNDGGAYGFAVLSAAAFALAVFTLPGCMTLYAVEGDPSVLRRPVAAFRRAWAHRRVYLFAWWISLLSIALSLLGLLALGVGFLFTSVWAWEVVGYAFTVALYGAAREPLESLIPHR